MIVKRAKQPALQVVRGAGKTEKPATGESTNPEPLARGVHRERSSYEGYVGYKAVAAGGKLVETAMVARELDTSEWTAWRVEQLWAAIEEYEQSAITDLLDAEKDRIAPTLRLD